MNRRQLQRMTKGTTMGATRLLEDRKAKRREVKLLARLIGFEWYSDRTPDELTAGFMRAMAKD